MLLVGAGQAHLEVVRRARRLQDAGLALTLVAPDNFRHAGLATAVLSGALPRNEERVVVERLCNRRGVDHIVERPLGMSQRNRHLWLGSGRALAYDAISFNLGSEINHQGFDTTGSEAQVWPVRPARRILDLHKALCADTAKGKAGVVAVVGGGSSGCEIAACIAALVEGSAMRVRLLTRNSRLLPQAPHAASRWLARELAGRGIDILLDAEVTSSNGRCINTADGRRFTADHVVLATGLRAPGAMQATGLPASDRGLLVRTGLYSPADPHVFAAGDCADITAHSLANHGAYGRRQGPLLAHNLVASLSKRRFRSCKPAHRHLVILELGNGTALAYRGRWWSHGRKSLNLKRRLECGLISRFRDPESS